VTSDENAVELKNICKKYSTGWKKPEVKALNGLDLSIKRGESLAILGPNGAGKSTLFKIITGLINSYDGEVSVLGQSGMSSSRKYARDLGFLPQGSCSDPYTSVKNNLAQEAKIRRLPRDVAEQRISYLTTQLGLQDKFDEWVMKLSGGTKRRLELAMTLLNNPTLVLMDEPCNGLDPTMKEAMWSDLVSVAQKEGVTIVFATHDFYEAENYAQRVIILDQGRVVADGTSEQLRERLGREVITISTADADTANQLKSVFIDSQLKVTQGSNSQSLRLILQAEDKPVEEVWRLMENANVEVVSKTVSRPTLADAYFDATKKML
jgi:ABC-2 type transport system ATP-binding protein